MTSAPTAALAAVPTEDPRAEKQRLLEKQRLRELQRDVARDPADPDKWVTLALFATIIGEYPEAIDAFGDARKRRSKQDGYFWLFMGIAAAKTGRHEDALLAFSEVARAAPDDPSAWVLKAMALENLGR